MASYKNIRADLMRAMQVVRELIIRATSITLRERLLELFDALHRELAAIDSTALAHSDAEYRAITLRFASSKGALDAARERALHTAASLGAVAQFIQSLANLAAEL